MFKNPRNAKGNFTRLYPFIASADAQEDNHFTFHSEGFMPLSVENLSLFWQGFPVYSMMHYYVQEGDIMRDPDMTFAVDVEGQNIIPLTFQQDGFPNEYGTLYQEVMTSDGLGYRPGLLKDLDIFLAQWSRNIIDQGFSPDEPTRPLSLDEFAARHASAD